MLCIAETVLPVVGFATGLPVVSRAPLLRTCPGFSEQFCSYLQRRIMVLEYLLYSSAANLLGSSYVSTPSVPPEFIAEVRSALLTRSSVLASEIGVLVQELGKRYELSLHLRDLGGAHAFVETHLADLFVKDPSPFSIGPKLRFLARAALPVAPPIQTDARSQSAQPDSPICADGDGRWLSADGRDRSFWDNFNNPLRAARFALTSDGTLYWTESAISLPVGARAIRPMQSDDYRVLAQQFADATEDAAARERMQRVISESRSRYFSTDWFRLVGVLGQRPSWESVRISKVMDALRERLVSAGASAATADIYAAELNKSRMSSKPKQSASTSAGAKSQEEGGATQDLQRLFADLARVLSEEEIRELRVPFGKVVDFLTDRIRQGKMR